MPFQVTEFWADQEAENPPLTNALIEAAEESLAVRLPPEFVHLLRIHNGGYTRGFVIPTRTRTRWAADHVPFDQLFGIGSEEPTGCTNILSTAYMSAEWNLPPKQVLLSGDGHWWISLDYRSGPDPTVAWLDTESGQEEILAPSFGALLVALLPESAVDHETGRLKDGGGGP